MDQPVVFGGKYTVVRRLDSGGVAATFEATAPTGQTVVVKSFTGLSPEQIAWLQQSAQAAAGVTSSYVARVLDWGAEGDQFFLVREFVAGTDVGSVVAANGPMPAHQAAMYGAEIAGALAALHGHGVVHGNVKPANVLLTPDNQVKLVGVGAPPMPAHITAEAPPTAAMFLSPEQVQGQAATYESDVYGAGATLYSLATGKYPFQGADAEQVAQNVVGVMPPAPARVAPGIPNGLDVTIVRAMQKNPADRQGSAAELQQELQSEAGQTQMMPAAAAAPVVEKKKTPIWPWIVIGLIVLAALAGLGYWWWSSSQNTVAVPNLSGMTAAQATTALNSAQLLLGTVSNTQQVQAGTAAGAVVQQDPAAGAKTPKGSKVNITLNGPSLAPVPNVVGQTEAQALQNLQTAGFVAGASKQAFDSKVPVGNVIAQDPAAGTQVAKGSTVTLTVSKGQEQGAVPNTVGMSQADATAAIGKAGFKVAVTTASSSAVTNGNVISQAPAGGVTAVAGATVTITVSTGPPAPTKVKVPALTGDTWQQASNALTNVSLVISPASSSTTGTVNTQSPSAGTMVDPNTTVTLTFK